MAQGRIRAVKQFFFDVSKGFSRKPETGVDPIASIRGTFELCWWGRLAGARPLIRRRPPGRRVFQNSNKERKYD
jgi:hypothetical protein